MPNSKGNRARNGRLRLRAFQVLLAVLLLVIWHVLTSPTLLPPIYFSEPNQAAFFFGEPLKVFGRLWRWFVSGEIYEHLWVTLVETLLAFLIGTVFGAVRAHDHRPCTISMPGAGGKASGCSSS